MNRPVLGVLLLAAFGCNHRDGGSRSFVLPEPIKMTPASEQALFPLAEGNTWIYDAENVTTDEIRDTVSRRQMELIFKLSHVKQLGEKTQGYLTVSLGDSPIDASVWQVDPHGITQVSSGVENVNYSTPEPVITFPLTPNSTVAWSNVGQMPNGMRGSQTGKTVVTLAPQIDTATSTVAGVASEATSEFRTKGGSGTATTTTWFQPGVGIVRLLQSVKRNDGTTDVTTLRLKSWTLQHS